MSDDPTPVQATRITPEEEGLLRGTPMRTARVKVLEPPKPGDVQRARVRGFVIGATVAMGAGLVAAAGYFFIRGKRKPRIRRHHA